MSAMEQAELVEGCRRGRRGAQRELYERYAERIYRLTLRLSGNEQDAADLTQDTFIRAFERFASFDGRSDVGTWLYRIATNEALQLFRRRRSEQRHRALLAQYRPALKDRPVEPDLPDVENALLRLPEVHRAVLVLKYQEGLSYDQIAEILQIAPGTVASRMNRARAELRALLGAQGAPAEEIHGNGHRTNGPAPPAGAADEGWESG